MTRTARIAAAAALVAAPAALIAALGGCLGALEPDVGDLVEPVCSDEDGDPDVDVSFADDLLGRHFVDEPGLCLSCHDPSGEINAGYTVGGLDLTSHGGLMAGGANSADDTVVPGAPCDSVLVEKLGPAPPFGGRMPLDGPPFLDDGAVAKIADWIAEGADDD